MTRKSRGNETTAGGVLRSHLTDQLEDVFAVGFSEELVEALIEQLTELDDPPRVRLITWESVLKWIRSDFLTASAAADLVESDRFALRISDDRFDNVLLVTDNSVVALVSADETVAGLETTDAEFVESIREEWVAIWDEAEGFPLRTPAQSHVKKTLSEDFGSEIESDFEAMLTALDTTRGEDDTLDEVVLSLLVAAKHEQLLYDISKWGEDTGVASKATFSRTKTLLEERGVLDTKKVPIDVGRPRLRLVLGDERLREADAGELVSVAQGLLSTGS